MNVMNQKIFNKSDESRIRCDLESEPCYQWIRSLDSYYRYNAGYVDIRGAVRNGYIGNYNGALPVCLI